jgi:hypothetical protein
LNRPARALDDNKNALMPQSHQYLRIEIDGGSYLLPGSASFAIEQRDHLVVNDTDNSPVAAWRVTKSERWPAYCLDRLFKPARRGQWQRVVFLEGAPYPIGLAVGEAQLMARTEVIVEPFTPPGRSPPDGHLFDAAWINGARATLVLNPAALVGYLRRLGGVR